MIDPSPPILIEYIVQTLRQIRTQCVGLALLAMTAILPSVSYAYPDFIGYGYTSCLTCHTNGHGGGAINDYGRGLWAAEIASRSLYSKQRRLDDLSQSSGFLGDTEKLPWWIRPHIKYRGIWVQRDPNSSRQTEKFYHMQLDMGGSISLDEDQKYLLYGNLGYVPSAESIKDNSLNRIIARDYYARIQIAEPLWLYVGKMEKVFGIRNIDHTSYSRTPLELTQNSQSHGAVVHIIQETYELAANVFIGAQDSLTPKNEQKGFSLMGEYQLIPRSRAGISLMRSNNEMEKQIQAISGHWRQGLSQGSSVMFEHGLFQKNDKALNSATNGSYTFVQSSILLAKGYSLLLNLERFNADTGISVPEQWKIGMGLLTFPINRVEFRMGAVHYRQVSAEAATPDTWAIQGQMHVSL